MSAFLSIQLLHRARRVASPRTRRQTSHVPPPILVLGGGNEVVSLRDEAERDRHGRPAEVRMVGVWSVPSALTASVLAAM